MTIARKIFALLRRAGSFLSGRKYRASVKSSFVDRRGTRRVSVHIPLFVYGRTVGGDPFYEEAYTIQVNGNGGLISMSNPVRPGQRLVVTNQGNEKTERCIVVSVAARASDRNNIALKFPEPAPHFWRGLEIGKGSAH
jgi:hypothetical protein